jgi:FkbM family methyltransferase
MTTFQIESRYGLINVFENDLISSFLTKYGEWAHLECEFLCLILDVKSPFIYDIGSFIGTFSLGMSGVINDSRFLAAEMNPLCWPVIENNCEKIKDHFQLIKGCIGKSNEIINLNFDTSLGNIGGTSVIEDSNCKVIDANQYTLSAIIHEYGVPDLIKMDIEGMELDVLRYSQRLIKQLKPVLWLECNEDVKSIRLFELLMWLGYEVYYFAFPSFNVSNFKASKELIFPCAYEAGFLALPEDREIILNELLLKNECIIKKVKCSQELKKYLWFTPRWAKNEWADMSKAELISLVGRLSGSENYANFLNSDHK